MENTTLLNIDSINKDHELNYNKERYEKLRNLDNNLLVRASNIKIEYSLYRFYGKYDEPKDLIIHSSIGSWIGHSISVRKINNLHTMTQSFIHFLNKMTDDEGETYLYEVLRKDRFADKDLNDTGRDIYNYYVVQKWVD